MPKLPSATLTAIALISSLGVATPASAQIPTPVLPVERRVEPVVLTGALLPDWSRLPAKGLADAYPDGALTGERNAHNGRLVVPPDARTGAPVDHVVAYRWTGTTFQEIPVQVDERFPYFLANPDSGFAFYSGTDEELTYEWDVESWLKTAGQCEATYPDGVTATQDPVATLDDDDEIVFMADDSGPQAPAGAPGPPGTIGPRYEVLLQDPLAPNQPRYTYLFQKPSGSRFNADNGYVDYERDANADQWIDRRSFSPNDPEILGSSNTGYGPNLSGTVCDPDGTVRQSTDRFPRDGVTVRTDTYEWRATGRWMVREMHVTKPGTARTYGEDLIDRWKGRAFQQSPDSSISLVGFEDEQVNWEANSSLLGELQGPVRAIRETWGADSGTNVTKIETFYRDAVVYRYHVRVHPIPPDGLYTSWDYNAGVAVKYFNETKTGGVDIDGVNDDIGNVDSIGNFPAFFDAPDPTFTKPLAFLNWEQVSGRADSGSLVYMFEINDARSAQHPAVTPYYRDDACLDDGTGDNPSPRVMPGESFSSTPQEYRDRPCLTPNNAGLPGPFRQGAFGQHGIHFFVTGDTDNAFSPVTSTEIDGQQWQWAVPTAAPVNVGDAYANTRKYPLVAIPVSQANEAGRETSTLVISGATSGQTTDQATLAADLRTDSGPVSGAEVVFTLDGSEVGRDTTDQHGRAELPVELSGPARQAVLTASYAGDAERTPSAASGPFQINHEDTTTTVTLREVGNSFEIVATLVDADEDTGIGGAPIRFSVDGRDLGAVVTDDQGVATITIRKKDFKPGAVATAAFAGDGSFLASSGSAQRPKV